MLICIRFTLTSAEAEVYITYNKSKDLQLYKINQRKTNTHFNFISTEDKKIV